MADMAKDASADLNLLFGILALQIDFIDRDQLVQAMNAWVLDKSSPLGRILVDKGFLSKSRFHVLDALVKEHLKEHNNNPEESLTAVASVTRSIGDLRDALSILDDTEIQQSLVRVSTPNENADVFQTQPGSAVADSSVSQRFRILRPHAKGGVGQVSVAKDQELNREVALKEIQPRYADDQVSRTRFMLEAEITGGLEHPGIVPVYGLGSHEDGRPYYAMRFLRGDSLKRAIERYHKVKSKKRDPGELALEFRKLLRRFVDVCNAMEYAHGRHVLHRDLKPGNVMLGKYGETMVVDWGMAKVIDADAEEPTVDLDQTPITPSVNKDVVATSMGSTVGTPPYMSPEQAAGRLDRLGPRSDIYGLGATLYHILTGQPPFFDRDVGSVLKRVVQGDFRPPREVDPQVPKPLQAVCLKAMAHKPEDRYANAVDLADDIEYWLADEPVSAFNDTWLQRVARWLRHHKAWALAAAATLVLLTIVSTVAALLINQAKQREERQRDYAVARLQDARAAVDKWVTGGAEALKHHAMFQGIRLQLLEMAVNDYRELANQKTDDQELEIERGRAMVRLAGALRMLGKADEAEKPYDEAISIFESYPDNSDAKLELANSHTAKGLLLAELNRREDAEKSYRRAIDILRPITDQVPVHVDFSNALGIAYLNIATLYQDGGRLAEAEIQLQQAIGQLEKSTNSNKVEDVVALANARIGLGRTLLDQGRFEESLAAFDKALNEAYATLTRITNDPFPVGTSDDASSQLAQWQQRAHPDYVQIRTVVATASLDRANALGKLGRHAQQMEAYQQAVDGYQDLTDTLPYMRTYRESLAAALRNQGHMLYRLGDTKRADDALQSGARQFVMLENEFGLPRYTEGKATCYDSIGVRFNDGGDHEQAAEIHRDVITFLENLDNSVPRYRERAAIARYRRARALQQTRRKRCRRECIQPGDHHTRIDGPGTARTSPVAR